MFLEKVVQLMIIHRVHKRFEESAKNAQIERDKKKEQNNEDSFLDILNRKLKEYTESHDLDDSPTFDDDDDDDDTK